MLFSKAISKAEWEANAPLREAMAIKRERLRAAREMVLVLSARVPTFVTYSLVKPLNPG
jgi:hypothetical protein